MQSLMQNRSVWLGLVLGALGGVRIWTMAATGVAALPHILAALTVLVPLTLFGVFVRRAWPAGLALAIVVAIELSLA